MISEFMQITEKIMLLQEKVRMINKQIEALKDARKMLEQKKTAEAYMGAR